MEFSYICDSQIKELVSYFLFFLTVEMFLSRNRVFFFVFFFLDFCVFKGLERQHQDTGMNSFFLQ